MTKTIMILQVGLIVSSAAQVASADSWPQFGGPRRNFQADDSSSTDDYQGKARLRWKIKLGDGLSSLVADDAALFVMYLALGDEENSKQQEQKEVVAAVSRTTGKVLWERSYPCGWIEQQEAFGGRLRSPQATPAIVGDSLITLGFTGILHCWERKTGTIKWKRNVVEDFGAVPVQFGFSSSPMIHAGKVFLLTGGQEGGLLCIDGESGEVQWNVPCGEASYATPTILDIEGDDHIVFVTRNRIVGVSMDRGELLWTYMLPYPGLTNVPTPLAMGDGRLVVSGQGVGGTIQLAIRRNEGEWKATEQWRHNTQFFYCNWHLLNELIIGCNDKLLVALDSDSGKRVGLWRGYENSNLVVSDGRIIILDGEGGLTVMQRDAAGMQVLASHQVLDQRCWTPPTLVDQSLFCRGSDEIVCVQWGDAAEGELLKQKELREANLAFRRSGVASSRPVKLDPVNEIVTAYETDGIDSAWKVYVKHRKEGTDRLSHDSRMQLVELALQEGLVGFAEQVKEHALEDFPESQTENASLRQLFQNKSPRAETETHLGENGLLYVQLAVRNVSHGTLQTEVQGPAKHPFGYGIPFPTGKVRIEKWPVGTRLFMSHNGVRGELLLTVKASDAGKTLQIRPSEAD